MTENIGESARAVIVRPLRVSDARRAASIHRTAFPTFFLSSLGAPFLRQFYRGFAERNDVVALVAVIQGEVVGVVVGPMDPDAFFKRLLIARWPWFAVTGLGAVVRRPRSIRRLGRALRYRGKVPGMPGGALLSSICVDPYRQTRGVGTALLTAWCAEVCSRGQTRAHLTTDAVDNERAVSFYIRNGWSLVGTYETADKRLMHAFEVTLSAPF